jgi:hypothetical protein
MIAGIVSFFVLLYLSCYNTDSRTIITISTLAFNHEIKKVETSLTKTVLTEDQFNYKHIAGLLKNNGNKTIGQITITANLLDESNRSLSNFTKETELRVLSPGETTPFDIMIFDKELDKKIKGYNIMVNYNTTNHNEKNLKVISQNNDLDVTGFYFISGKIRNEGITVTNSTTVTAVTYDKDGKILGIWRAQSEPYDIPPSATASFTIPITDKKEAFMISNYTLYLNS